LRRNSVSVADKRLRKSGCRVAALHLRELLLARVEEWTQGLFNTERTEDAESSPELGRNRNAKPEKAKSGRWLPLFAIHGITQER